jgi:nicotinamidase-related amidase
MSEHSEPLIPHLGLLVLDIQPPFLKVIGSADSLVGRSAFAVETARLFGLPTLFTEQRPEVLQSTVEELSELLPHAPRIAKTGFSAFTEPAIEEWIHENDLQHILIAGLETSICVYQTALDAINADIEVTLLSDAIGCRREKDGEAALASLRIHGAHLLPSESIFYSILRDSSHPRFKEFTALVKKYSDK